MGTMRKNGWILSLAAALAVAQAGLARAQSETPAAAAAPQQDVSTEIKALRERLDQLEKQQAEARRQQEIKDTTEKVSQDAARKSMLIDTSGFTAGYEDNRFVIRSADGNFALRPWLHLQFRNVTLWRQDFKAGDRDEIDNGFEMRRLKLGFDGNMFSPDLTYNINWATSRAPGTNNVTDASGTRIGTVSNSLGGVPILEEAWVRYHFAGTPWSIRGGQIKAPLLHDQIVSSRYQQSAERSLTADVFANGDAFTHGVTFIYDPKASFRFEGGITDGIRSANTNFLDNPQSGNGYDYGVAGRAEFKLMGRWEDYGQVGAVGIKQPLFVIGVGADYSERGDSNETVGVIDAQYADPGGLNLYAAAVDRYTHNNVGFPLPTASGAAFATPSPGVAGDDTNEYSLLLQGGYLIHQRWEPFGRYEYMHLAGTPAGSENNIHVITAGVNYYWVGHRAKFTAEIQYLPNGLPFDDSGNALLTNNGNGELSAVLQFQLLL
jgi:hypothetical protein